MYIGVNGYVKSLTSITDKTHLEHHLATQFSTISLLISSIKIKLMTSYLI